MANWDKFRDTVSTTANKAAHKAGELTDVVKLPCTRGWIFPLWAWLTRKKKATPFCINCSH